MSTDTRNADTARPKLFSPIKLRGLQIKNRIWMPPMDMYSAPTGTGMPTSFHDQHYTSRAYGGFGLIIVESTAVNSTAGLSPQDVGIWNDAQGQAWAQIVEHVHAAGAAVAMQLNHGGRKGSSGSWSMDYHSSQTVPPCDGGWQTKAPSAIPFGSMDTPQELTVDEIHSIVRDFGCAADRAVAAGFDAVQIHAAHGYLAAQFLDPLCNQRSDEYGGSLENRQRFLLEVTDEIRARLPEDMPLLVRISATDYAEPEGWDVQQTIQTARVLKEHGVDLVDVSSGGILDGVSMDVYPGYQVRFSEAVRAGAGVPVTAVGLISDAAQAEKILQEGKADAVEIGRAALADPYWPLNAGLDLGLEPEDICYPPQYLRAVKLRRLPRGCHA